MIKKYNNKYRITSARLPQWDYGNSANYFVTICTKNRESYFGNIDQGVMQLSPLGDIALKFWLEMPAHFPFLTLDAFVIMPNHVHGIIVIDKIHAPTIGSMHPVETPKLGVSTTLGVSTNLGVSTASNTDAASQKWKPATLGVVINQYKRIVTIHARKIEAGYAWQSRFHDHIIRNYESYLKIRNYILYNPMNWTNDSLNHITE